MGRQFTIILAVLVLILGGTSFYFYGRYKMLQKNPQAVQQEEAKEITNKVGKLIELPTGETPVVATVADLEALKGQEFFTHAQVGDKVIIYTNTLKAILYRPSTNKIIEVAPVVLGPGQQGKDLKPLTAPSSGEEAPTSSSDSSNGVNEGDASVNTP